LGEDLGLFRSVLSNFAESMKKSNPPRSASFKVTQEMRDGVYERLHISGLDLPSDTYEAASGYVDEQLGYEITRVVFGPVAEARRRALSDRQMQVAVRLLRRAGTQEHVLALAKSDRARGITR
jgi:hypothetical protein